MNGIKTYQEWEIFSKGYPKISVYLTPEQIFYQSPAEKEKRAKQKVEEMFLEKGVLITRYRHNYDARDNKDYWGLVFHRTDSDIIERVEITALIGVNAAWNNG
jgi:hypothetical protein